MYKIKDRIILGAIAGYVGGFIGKITNYIASEQKWNSVNYINMMAKLFLPKNKANSTAGKVTGALADNTGVCLTGIGICYILSMTGRRKAVIKGAGFSTFLWLVIFGVFNDKQKSKQKPWGPVLSYFDHFLLGAISAYIINKFGDDSLFPDSKKQLPIISTGENSQN